MTWARTDAAVSVVICTHESRGRLEATLPSWGAHDRVGEIVVVDAFSIDGTADWLLSIRERFPKPLRVISAPLEGLARARNRGSEAASGHFILHAGPDNILPERTLTCMLAELEHHTLVSCVTRIADSARYLDRAHDLSKRRFRPGPDLGVVGTPYVAHRDVFLDNPFNPTMEHADDTEFCSRLVSGGARILRTEEPCLEVGFSTLADLRERWSRWGTSDSQFHREMRPRWTLRRRLRSLRWSLVAEIVEPARTLRLTEYLYGLPFFLVAGIFRTAGRVGAWQRSRGRTSGHASR